MNNAPEVRIKYLANYELNVVPRYAPDLINPLSDLTNINNENAKVIGKKGLILSGGSVDETTGEVSGTLLDGTYTFFKDSQNSYNGILSDSLSLDDYTFIHENASEIYENKMGIELNQFLLSNPRPTFVQANVDENTSGIYYILKDNIYVQVLLPMYYNKDEIYYIAENETYTYYCTAFHAYEGRRFFDDVVYEFKWQVFVDKEYTQESLDATASGTYYVKTDEIDAFGNPIYNSVELPTQFDPTQVYYSVSIVDNSRYVYSVKESSQKIRIYAPLDKYMRDILIYFDPMCGEYASEITFTEAEKMDYVETKFQAGYSDWVYKKVDGKYISVKLPADYDPETSTDVYYKFRLTDEPKYDGSTIHKNNQMIFIYNFGENSTLARISINIKKWSKKNSLMKISKIVTGYTGIYDSSNLLKADFTINKTNDAQQLRFGVTSNTCTLNLLDKDLMINTLYEKELILKNIEVQILVDDIVQGVFYINEKSSEKGTNQWTFECLDKLEQLKDITRPMMSIGKRNVYEIMTYVLSGISLEVSWEKKAKEYCESIIIEQSYFEANQTLYDLMLKCCQVGLLRIYIDRNNVCKITSGVN